MNEMKVDEIKRNDEMILLDKYFPGISCGNQNCEKKAVLLCKIFSKMPLMTKKEIQLLLQTNIAKYKNCKDVFCCRFFADKTISCFSDSSEVKFIFHAGNNECKKCASLDKTTVTETELRDSRKMRSKGFFMQKDGIYRPHPNCKCRWEIKENRPSLLPKTISDNIKNIYAALEYSVIQNLGSQVYGIGVDVAKIGTKIITDIRFFSLYVRRKISIYEKFTHVDCTEDHFLLADFYNKNSWRDISRLNNKYTNLLKKVQQK